MLSCAIALGAIGCGSEEPSATEATEPETSATTGSESPVAEAPAPAPAPSPEPAAPPEPATPAAQPAPPQPSMPPSAMMVVHKVKDFAAWKTVFDSHEQARKDNGVIAHGISTDVSNPKNVSVWLGTADLAKVEAFSTSDDLKAKMKEGGVIGKPTIITMNNVAQSPMAAGAAPAKFGALVDQKVKDYAAWKAVFDGDQQARTDGGVTGWGIAQDAKDPTHVYVWLEGDDKDKLTAYTKSKELKAKNKEGGVKGAAKVSVWENTEMKMYQ